MNKLLEELQSRQTDSLWSYKWWLDMQLNKLAMITGLALVKAEDPIPDHVPTLDERNERDYQSAYAQVEREWRRDVGLHDYQPVFAQVCAVMNLIGVEHLNHEYNRPRRSRLVCLQRLLLGTSRTMRRRVTQTMRMMFSERQTRGRPLST